MGMALTIAGNWTLICAMAFAVLILPEYAMLLLAYGIAITAADSAVMAIAGQSEPADRLADAAIVYLAVYSIVTVIRVARQVRPLR